MIKLRATLGVSALALLLNAAPVLANEVDVQGENNTTGADSTNVNNHTITGDVTVDETNDGTVDNTADATVETGNNQQNENTEGGDLESGEVDASTDWETVVNEGAGMLGGHEHGLEVSGDFENDTTGADSENRNVLDFQGDVTLDWENTADVTNDLTLDATTGNNEQNRNTEAGDLESGDITGDFAISNEANSGNAGSAAAAGETEVDLDFSNERTGADSENVNRARVTNNHTVTVTNDASLTNTIDVTGNTGGNRSNRNTEGGDVRSGDIEVSTDIENVANSSSTSHSSGSQSSEISADFSNDKTGAGSENRNTVNVESNRTHTVDNTADVTNDLTVDANSGDNESNRNTEGGDVRSGDVTIDFSAMNQVN